MMLSPHVTAERSTLYGGDHMLLNDADNIICYTNNPTLYSDIGAFRVYSGSTKVWERSRVLPSGFTATNGYYMNRAPINTHFKSNSGILKVEADITVASIDATMSIIGGYNSEPYSASRPSHGIYVEPGDEVNAALVVAYIFDPNQGYKDAAVKINITRYLNIQATISEKNIDVSCQGKSLPRPYLDEYRPISREIWIGSNGDPVHGEKIQYLTGTIHTMKLYDDTALRRDFVPVKRNSDGQEGLFDFMTRKFYH